VDVPLIALARESGNVRVAVPSELFEAMQPDACVAVSPEVTALRASIDANV
jgi:hypothetical protein